jgi:DNA-binding NarL/FixJ family response regulator
MPIRVVLVDDHALVRSGMRVLLQQMSGIEVAGEAVNGREALALVERVRPQVVLMDISMPELNGLEAAERLRRERPEVRIVLLSMHADEAYVGRALGIGASGYVLKSGDATELEQAIRIAARGGSYLSPPVSRVATAGGLPDGAGKLPLTPRQREIVQLIAEGNSTREIAGKLHVSVKTVETHRANLMRRLGIHDVPGLVRYAIRTGLAGAGR